MSAKMDAVDDDVAFTIEEYACAIYSSNQK